MAFIAPHQNVSNKFLADHEWFTEFSDKLKEDLPPLALNEKIFKINTNNFNLIDYSKLKAFIFKNGQNQTVKLPKDFRFEGAEVYVQKVGRGVLLLPVDNSPWEFFRQSFDLFSSDFMEERQQSLSQKRDTF